MSIIKFIQMIISIFMKERYKMFLTISFLVILVDQIIKMIITKNIPYGYFIGNNIKITNISNTGMAYSMRKRLSATNNNFKYYYSRAIVNFCYKKI